VILVSLRQLETDTGLNAYTQGAVRDAVKDIVGVQFRNLATVGGSIWGRFGFSDVLTVFLAMDTEVELFQGGRIPLKDFAEKKQDRDILVRLIVKKTAGRFAYAAVRNQSTDFPVIACAASCVGGEYRLAAIVSCNLADLDSAYVSDCLAENYGIATRAGAHCAPQIHTHFGTEKQGMVRFSFSCFNTTEEVEKAVRAMQDIAAENRGKVTAYVGAGGKTSSIRKRAETLRAEGKRVLILTTTKMMVPQEQEIFTAYEQTGQESVISATASVWQERRAAEKQLKERVQSVLDTYGCCVAGSLIPDTEKFGMLPEKLMEDLLYLADEILIEADGSAHMPVKAPAEHEPVLFPYMDEVVIVMGAHAIGKPLREVCHRADYAKKILKCDADKIVTATDIRVLAEQGYAIPIQKQFPWMKISKVTGKDIKLCLTAEKKDKERDKQ